VNLHAAEHGAEIAAKRQTFSEVLIHIFPQNFFRQWWRVRYCRSSSLR
jgi:hypothetical protein